MRLSQTIRFQNSKAKYLAHATKKLNNCSKNTQNKLHR